jgi:hypothetical protein
MGQQRKDHREREPLLRCSDRREGQWTKLQLLEMDERFQMAVRRGLAEPDLLQPRRPRRGETL